MSLPILSLCVVLCCVQIYHGLGAPCCYREHPAVARKQVGEKVSWCGHRRLRGQVSPFSIRCWSVEYCWLISTSLYAIVYHSSNSSSGKKAKPLDASSKQAILLKQEFVLDEYEAFDDYLEMVIAFGYVEILNICVVRYHCLVSFGYWCCCVFLSGQIHIPLRVGLPFGVGAHCHLCDHWSALRLVTEPEVKCACVILIFPVLRFVQALLGVQTTHSSTGTVELCVVLSWI